MAIQGELIIMKQPAVYIMANQRNGTLNTGVTSDLVKRDMSIKQVYMLDLVRNMVVNNSCFISFMKQWRLPFNVKHKLKKDQEKIN